MSEEKDIQETLGYLCQLTRHESWIYRDGRFVARDIRSGSEKADDIAAALRSIATNEEDVVINRNLTFDSPTIRSTNNQTFDEVSIGEDSFDIMRVLIQLLFSSPADSGTLASQVRTYSQQPENSAKLEEIHEQFKRTSIWQRIGDKIDQNSQYNRDRLRALVEENFKSLGRRIFRLIQTQYPEAANDEELKEDLRRQYRRILDGSLKEILNFGDHEAVTLLRDSEQFLREAIVRDFGLGQTIT